MSPDTILSVVAQFRERLTDPLIAVPQLSVVLGPILIFRQFSLVSAQHPAIVLTAVPALAYLTLSVPVGVVQEITIRTEERLSDGDEVGACWDSITDRAILWFNVALIIPVAVWGVPITGSLGYTAEAFAATVFGETISADHTLAATIVVGLVLVGTAGGVLGVLVSVRMYLRPTFSEDRLQMYLGLRSSFPVQQRDTLAPLVDGGRARLATTTLADACVRFTLTGVLPDDLPHPVDIEQIVAATTPQPASTRVRFAFLISPDGRFLSGLFGGMLFVIGVAFGITLDSVSGITLVIGTVIGIFSQFTYDYPFVAGAPTILE